VLPPATDAPATAGRDAGCHEPTVTRPQPPGDTRSTTAPGRRHGPRSPRLRRTRVAAVMTVIAAAALLATACSSGSPSSAGSGGSPNAGGSANSSSAVAYSRCVRSHGVPDFPDPDSSGQLPKEAVVRALRGVSDSRARAATNACANLNPAGRGNPTLTAQEQQDYLKAAACMRSHGINQLPRPDLPRRACQPLHPLQHRYQVKAVHPGRADLHKTHPRRTPLQQAGWLKTMAGSKAGGGS